MDTTDKARKGRRVTPSRHTWLLEALLEKLETEEGSQGEIQDRRGLLSTGGADAHL